MRTADSEMPGRHEARRCGAPSQASRIRPEGEKRRPRSAGEVGRLPILLVETDGTLDCMTHVALYVILVQYGSWLPVLNCLHWLVASGQALDRTVVVANGPGVPPSPWPNRLKGCRLIQSPRNIGFAAACNVGLRHAMRAGAEAALVLNPNCFFAPDMLSRLWASRTSP